MKAARILGRCVRMSEHSSRAAGHTSSGRQFLTMDELRDITEHLLRFSPDALIVVDDSARIRFANETVTDLFGYAPEALIGQPLGTLIPERLRIHHDKYTAAYMREPSNR